MKLRYGLALASALSLTLGACASSGGGAAPAAPVVSGGQVLSQGERPRETEDTRAAQRHLEQAEASATEAEAQGHYEAAVQSAQAAVAADSLNPLAYRLAAEAYLGAGNYEMAGEMFDEAERLRPVYTLETERIREMAWIDRYQAAAPLVNSGEYEAAIELFEQADAIYEGRPEVKTTLGQLYPQVGRFDEAVEALEEAQAIIQSERIAEMDSTTAAQWRESGEQIPAMIAQTLVNAERYDEAADALRDLLAADPGNAGYLRTLGTTYVRMEQPDSARAVFEELLAQPGLQSSDYYAAGVGLYQMEDYTGAADAFERAAEASVNDRDAVEMWARSLQIAWPVGADAPEPPAGTLEELRGAAERWLELDPNNQNAHLILAQTANRLGDADRARDLVAAIEALPVVVENPTLQRGATGGGLIVGTVRNKTANPGTTATVEVTYYDAQGNTLGTETARVQLGAAESTQNFRVDLMTEEYIGGYSYRIVL